MLPRYLFEQRERARSAQSEAAHAHNPHWRISPRRERGELGDVGHMALYLDVVREADRIFSQFFGDRGAGRVASEGGGAPRSFQSGPRALGVRRRQTPGRREKNKKMGQVRKAGEGACGRYRLDEVGLLA